jgi:hypothetical protein
MAIATDTLMEEGKCYACFGPLSTYEILKLSLLRRIALTVNPSADVSAQGLLNTTNCYACLSMSTFDLLKLALMNIINGT